VLALVLVTASAARAADDAELVFPAGKSLTRLRLEVTAHGGASDRDWTTFLDRLFDYFDRNGDGFLSPAEAARVFPLPLANGKQVAIDFAALDIDRDGKASRDEFRAFYRGRGFTPLVLINQQAPAEVFALGEAIFQHLDRNRDGKLTAVELGQVSALLRRFDEDEDEVLTAAELLAPLKLPLTPRPAGLVLRTLRKNDQPSETVLRLPLDGSPPSLGGRTTTVQFSANGSQLRIPGGTCTVTVASADPLVGFRAARSFYLAQFTAAVGEQAATKKMFEEDPATGVLAGLFDAADRSGDGKLTRNELDTFFDLIELGIRCQIVITATDRGRNLFDLIDTNEDGRLDLGELTRAARVLPDLEGEKPMDRDTVPGSYRLVVGHGPVGNSFGPVPFGSAAKNKQKSAPAASVPRWFQAMDRNGDGYVSRQEFIGPPELFAKLDTDGDGRISREEAARADQKNIHP
jgi:Ca2+-binding EF-hand superfamily protein